MTRRILVRSEAAAEIKEAYHWYEKQRRGLGEDLLLCLEEAIAKIVRTPETYPVVHKNIRRILIHRFPYGVFYITEPSRIVLLALFHASRDPKQWKDRN